MDNEFFPFYLREDVAYLYVKQLEGYPEVVLKDILDDMKNVRPMPMSEKINTYLNPKLSTNNLSGSNILNKLDDGFGSNEKSTPAATDDNADATGLNNLLLEKEAENFGAPTEMKESKNQVCQSDLIPLDSRLIPNCNVNSITEAVQSPELISTKNHQEKEEVLPSSKYSSYLKKKRSSSAMEVDSRNQNEVAGCREAVKPAKSWPGDPLNSFSRYEAARENGRKKLRSSVLWNKAESTFGIAYEPAVETRLASFDSGFTSSSDDSELAPNAPDISVNEGMSEIIPLQEIVERMIHKSGLSCSLVDKLKRKLCYNWLENNFDCPSLSVCSFEHNARARFRKKMEKQPSNIIVEIIVEMRDDLLFVDALIEGFDILKSRPKSERLLSFVCFFAFYCTEPKDEKYLIFWCNAATYFCKLIESEDRVDGFAYLLKIFRQIDSTGQGKIIEFVEMLKNPYFNIEINFKILEPIIVLNLPSSLLLEAVESCNKSKVDVDEIYKEIISRIFVKSLSIEGVEILLQFCRTLEAEKRLENAAYLRQRLCSKVQTLTKPIDKDRHPLTYLYSCELEPRGSMIYDEEEDLEADEILKNDEEKLQNRTFPPPPPGCYLNPSFFVEHSSLPNKFEGPSRPPHSSSSRSKKRYTPPTRCWPYEVLIKKITNQIRNYEFSSVGENLNLFEGWVLKKAAEAIVREILSMKISPEGLLDFIQNVAITCNSRNSAKVISSIADTMIYTMAEKDDWEMAYSILKVCLEAEIDLSHGVIFASDQIESLSSFMIVLLLIEVCIINEKYESAYFLIEKYRFYSDLSILKPSSLRDNFMRINIVNDFLEKLKLNKSPLLLKTKMWELQDDPQEGV